MIHTRNLEIPNRPTLKLPSYTAKLSRKISVILEKDLLSQFVNDQVLKEISKSLNFHKTSVKRYFVRKRFPLSFIAELQKTVKTDIYGLIERSNPRFFSKWKSVRLPRYITPKLAYFIGYLQGDGSLESNEKKVNFTDEYFEQIDRINEICDDLFAIKGKIYAQRSSISKKPAYRLDIGSLVLNSFLHEVFGINRGRKLDLKVPPDILRNKTILKWYLVGLYDADGTLPKEPSKAKQLFIDITLKDKELILHIKDLLATFGITTLKPYCRKATYPTSSKISETWELRIRKRSEIIMFLKTVGFSHPHKLERQQKVLCLLGQ